MAGFMPPQARILSNMVPAGNWDKGWRASWNGRPVPVLRADYAVRVVVVPAGNGTLEFIYQPSQLDSRIMAGRSGRDCSSLLADSNPDPEGQNKTTFTIRAMSQPWGPAEKVRGRFSGRPGNVDLPRPWPVDDGGGRKGTHSGITGWCVSRILSGSGTRIAW